MKDKGKLFGILLPVLMVVVVAAIVLVSSGVLTDDSVTAAAVIAVESGEIEHIRVSQDVSSCSEDYEDALWTDVWDEEKIAAIHEAIGAVEVEQGDGFDDALAGGSSRYVEYILYDGSVVELRFADDMQMWLEGTCWHFEEWFVLYEQLDEILAGSEYVKAPGA